MCGENACPRRNNREVSAKAVAKPNEGFWHRADLNRMSCPSFARCGKQSLVKPGKSHSGR
jgi:hypothetical protein